MELTSHTNRGDRSAFRLFKPIADRGSRQSSTLFTSYPQRAAASSIRSETGKASGDAAQLGAVEGKQTGGVVVGERTGNRSTAGK